MSERCCDARAGRREGIYIDVTEVLTGTARVPRCSILVAPRCSSPAAPSCCSPIPAPTVYTLHSQFPLHQMLPPINRQHRAIQMTPRATRHVHHRPRDILWLA